jgi:hypothetical protein
MNEYSNNQGGIREQRHIAFLNLDELEKATGKVAHIGTCQCVDYGIVLSTGPREHYYNVILKDGRQLIMMQYQGDHYLLPKSVRPSIVNKDTSEAYMVDERLWDIVFYSIKPFIEQKVKLYNEGSMTYVQLFEDFATMYPWKILDVYATNDNREYANKVFGERLEAVTDNTLHKLIHWEKEEESNLQWDRWYHIMNSSVLGILVVTGELDA